MSLDGYDHDHRRGAHPLKHSDHEYLMHSGAAMAHEGAGQPAALPELENDGSLGHSQRQPNIGSNKSVARPDKGYKTR